MAHRLQLFFVVAVSLLTSAALAHAQTMRFAAGVTPGSGQFLGAPSAFSGQASAGSYTFASSPMQEENGQQQNNGNQSQSPAGNQNPGMNGNPNQNQNQNQEQEKKEAPPEKPQYLTYTHKKKSIQEEAKSGKSSAVDFRSVPAGAEVRVDGYFLGKTPMATQIPLGKHLVSITKWGYRAWEHELNVTSGKSASINPTLHKDW